jgi:hypothetical protein
MSCGREFWGRKGWEVEAGSSSSGSFALERRAQDDSKNKQRQVRIPVKWASDSGDVGRSRSEATLVVFYVSKVDHMRSRKA